MNCTCLAATPTITFFYVDGLTDYVRNTSKPFISPFFRKNPRAKPVFASFFSRKLMTALVSLIVLAAGIKYLSR